MNNYRLKRLFKKVLFFLIITILLWIFKLSFVNAATFSPYDFSINHNNNLPQDHWIVNGTRLILTVATSMQENQLNINERNYIEILACVAGGTSWSSYITNDDLNGAIQNGNVNYLNTGISCKATNQNYDGVYGKFYFKVYKWVIPSGQDLYQVSSYWNFTSSAASLVLDIRDVKITDNDNFYNDSLLVSNGKGQDVIINQNQNIINNGNATNQKLDDLNKNLTDESSPNLNGLENSAGWLKPGPVDSIINLPLTLLNNLQTNLGNTCNPVTVKLPYVNKDINLPCISAIYKQINGLDAWFQGIGVIAAAFILYRYFMYLYNRIDDTLSFRENNMQGYFDDSLWGGM